MSVKKKFRKKYEIIYADCPWHYRDKLKHANMRGAAEDHYTVLKPKQLMRLPINKIVAKNAVCFMWATDPQFPVALKVMEAWGFEFKTIAFWWIKLNPKKRSLFSEFLTNLLKIAERWIPRLKRGVFDEFLESGDRDYLDEIKHYLKPENLVGNDILNLLTVFYGLGRWSRGNLEAVLLGTKGNEEQLIEACLLGTRGSPKRDDSSVDRLVFAPRGRHSAKPPEVRKRIDKLMGPNLSRIELFAREKAEGWEATGYELDGFDIQKLHDMFSPPRMKTKKKKISSNNGRPRPPKMRRKIKK
jgi:N6-adenosine-specific RNA methylase IME4